MSLIKRKIIHLIALNVLITSMLGCGASIYRHELSNDPARLEYKPPLAQEWRLIDFPHHHSVASLEGRKNFLRQLIFSSPASLALGLRERIADEIQSMQ
jgi:hypothetical protein